MSTHRPSTSSLAGTLRRVATQLRDPAERLAFWSAILLPFCYIPLLYVGTDGIGSLVLFALIAANVAALFVGHDHNREN